MAKETNSSLKSPINTTLKLFREALVVSFAFSAIGLLVNLVHPNKIPYVAKQAYEILVPCPEPGGKVTPLAPNREERFYEDAFLVDARSKEDFATWHFLSATNVPFDYLDPTPKETIQALAKEIARSRAQKVLVYGDGDTPDTGEQLGKEISGYGIKNVFFLKGGAPRLRALTAAGGDR